MRSKKVQEKHKKNLKKLKPNLEKDLLDCDVVSRRVRNIKNFDVDLYRGLCNIVWEKDGETNSFSWRFAGSLVSDIKNKTLIEKGKLGVDDTDLYISDDGFNFDYLDYYCSGLEGQLTPLVRKTLRRLGWYPVDYEDPNGIRHLDEFKNLE